MRSAFTENEKGFIQNERVTRFNSLTPRGRIHSVPICFAFDGSSFFFHALFDRKRWRDASKNSEASLELDSYSDDWSKLKGVLIYGGMKFLESGAEHDGGLRLLREKYIQYRSGSHTLPENTKIVKFEPSGIVSWAL